MGDLDESAAHLTEALELADDDLAKANAHLGLGWLCERRGDHHEALERAEHALSHYRRAGDRGGEAFALNNIGSHQSRLGRYREAIASCGQALTLHQESGDHRGQADAWEPRLRPPGAGRPRAITCYRNAQQLFAALTDRHAEADVLIHLGDALQASGNDAAECWERALHILTELDHPAAEEVKLRLKA